MSVAPKDSVSIEAGALTQKARAGKLNPITKNNIHQFYYNVFMYLNTKKNNLIVFLVTSGKIFYRILQLN